MKYEVVQLADGWAGTDETVRRVQQLVDDSLTDPLVRMTAEAIVRRLPERDVDAEIRAVSRFVRKKIRYTNEGAETLKTPRVMLEEIRQYGRAVGDCDDHCILWLALHKVLGHKARFKVISQRRDGVANHIYGQVMSPSRGWVTDDTIKKDKPLGWEAPQMRVTKWKHYHAGGAPELEGLEALRSQASGSSSRSLATNNPHGGTGQYGFSVSQAYGFADKQQVGIIPALIVAGATIASVAASAAMQARQEKVAKKAAKAAKKAQDKEAKRYEEEAKKAEAEAAAAAGSPIAASTGGGLFAGLPSWAPLAALGAAAIGLVFLLPGKKGGR